MESSAETLRLAAEICSEMKQPGSTHCVALARLDFSAERLAGVKLSIVSPRVSATVTTLAETVLIATPASSGEKGG